MAWPALLAVLLLAVAPVSSGLAAPLAFSARTQSDSSEPRHDVPLLALASIGRLFDAVDRSRRSMAEGERVAAWTDFSLLVEAVVGDAQVGPLVFDDLVNIANAQVAHVMVTPGLASRDRMAYQLLALGYSPRETADVISGRISQKALDTARQMLMVGWGHDAADNYLDTQYKRLISLKRPPTVIPEATRTAPDEFEAAIERNARLRGVDVELVRAIIAVESAFNPQARSPAGAVGLMQLMPATARALGVDPISPEQNIEGGVRYLSELLAMFGGTELALIAYNGGPEFARRYARGETALYGETRDYVKQVLAGAQRGR